MSDYSQITDFSAKDALTTGDPEKIILGSDVDVELGAISTAIATKYDSPSDVLTALLTVDGAGSGLDADLLDGVSSAAFAQLSANNTFTGALQTVSGVSGRWEALDGTVNARMMAEASSAAVEIGAVSNHPLKFLSNGLVRAFFAADGSEFQVDTTTLDFNGNADISGTLVVGGNSTFSSQATFSSALITSSGPTLRFTETDGAANNRVWDEFISSERLLFRLVDDAISTSSNWMAVDRTGNTCDEIELNATLFDFNGNLDLSGTSAHGGAATFSGAQGLSGAVKIGDGADNASANIDLYVTRNGPARFFVRNSTDDVESELSSEAAATGVVLGSRTLHPLLIRTNSAPRITIAADGSAISLAATQVSFSNNVAISGTAISLASGTTITTGGGTLTINGTGETMATFADDGAVTLFHNNVAKLATAAGGVDVTGTVTGSTGLVATTGGLTVSAGGVNVTGTVTTPNTSANEVGYKGAPGRNVGASTNTAATDAGGTIHFTSGSGQTFTLDSDPPTDSLVVLENQSANSWTIAASGTLYWAATQTTGSRTLANNGMAVALHRGSGNWVINGGGLS